MRSLALGGRSNIRHVAAAWLGVLALVLQTYFPLAVTAIAAHLATPDTMLLCAAATEDGAAAAPADEDAAGKPTAPPAGHVHQHCPGCFIHAGGAKALAASPAAPSPPVRSVTDRLVPAEPASAARRPPAAFYSPRGPPSYLHPIPV